MDREHQGESPSHSPNYAGDGAGDQQRRKWHLNPVGARRYHELSKSKGGLAYQLLANLANTKRSITEIIERSRRSEWLKINSCDQEESYQVEIDEIRREAKEQVKNTITNTSTYEWLKKNKNCNNYQKPCQELPKKTNDRTFRINSATSLEMIHGSRESMEDNATTSRIRTEKRELRNKLIRKIRKRTEGVEEDDHLLNANEDIPARLSERRRVVESFKTGTAKNTLGNLRERPAIVMPRIKHLQAVPIPAQKILSVERCATRSREGLQPPEVTSSVIKQKIKSTLPDRTNLMFSARERPKVFINTKEKQFQITPRKERLESNRMSPIQKLSGTSIQVEPPYYVLPRPVAKRFPEGPTANIGKRNEGEFSGSLIPNNSNTYPDVFNNFTDFHTQNLFREHNNNWESQLDTRTEDNTYLLPSGSPSKESIASPKFSDESIKWNFPNSNRKREEKLRELRDGTEYVETIDINSKGSNNVSKLNFTDTFSEINRNQYLTNLLADHSERSSVINETEYGDDQKCILLEEINTESALMYLSETLIESAQRAELLLMQKMKEYNDLVCREPPPKNMQDNACQVNVPEVDTDFDKKFKEMVEKFTHELQEKNIRINQLENEVKKAKLASKMNPLSGRTSPPEGNENEETGGNPTERATTSYPSNSKQYSALENEQLVQALRLENNLLHNLLKEMKAELQQENATIFSLAKKLEISMTQTQNNQQTIHKHSARDTDNSVVRELEFKLEQQEKVLKKEAMEARAVAKYVIMKYTNLIAEYKQKVKSHQETVGKLKNAIK